MKKKYHLYGLIAIAIVITFFSFSYAQVDKETPGKEPPKGEIAADSNQYMIGAEDVLYIHVWKEETITRTVTVRMDGRISMPLIDDIQAAGKTPLQLKEELTRKLKEFIDNPTASVIVMEANSFKVYVSGQVKTPGVYRLRSETSIAQIISMAGGLTEWANPKKISVIRKEDGKEKRILVNFKKVIQGDDLSENLILKAGDTIIIP